jgi:hypothetical protein
MLAREQVGMKLLQPSRIATHVEFLEEAGACAQCQPAAEPLILNDADQCVGECRDVSGRYQYSRHLRLDHFRMCAHWGRDYGEAMRQAFEYRHRQALGVGGKN